MRMAASCCQPWQESEVPRGARTAWYPATSSVASFDIETSHHILTHHGRNFAGCHLVKKRLAALRDVPPYARVEESQWIILRSQNHFSMLWTSMRTRAPRCTGPPTVGSPSPRKKCCGA